MYGLTYSFYHPRGEALYWWQWLEEHEEKKILFQVHLEGRKEFKQGNSNQNVLQMFRPEQKFANILHFTKRKSLYIHLDLAAPETGDISSVQDASLKR